MNKDKGIFLADSCNLQYLDNFADSVLWTNGYCAEKAVELNLYNVNVKQEKIPEFWEKREDFCQGKEFLDKIYNVVLENLSRQLDEIHNVKFGVKGWNIILYYWLYYFLSTFYDKYVRIKYAVENYSDLYYKGVMEWYIPRGSDLNYDEKIQIQQYVDICEYLDLRDINRQDNIYERFEILEGAKVNKNVIIHQKFEHLKKIFYLKRCKMNIFAEILSFDKVWLEILSLGKIRKLTISDEINFKNDISLEIRHKIKLEKDFGDEFLNLFYRCVWKYIPMKYIEDFKGYYAKGLEVGSEFPSKIVASGLIYNNIIFQIFVINAIKHGCKLDIIQHGGNYCVEKYIGRFEYDIADKFYTWGNGFVKEKRCDMYAMPVAKTLGIRKQRNFNQGRILFVEYSFYPNIVRFVNFYTMKMKKIYEQEDIFLSNLNTENKQLLSMRCYHVEYGWNRKETLSKHHPWIQFDLNKRYYESLRTARLVVTNVISTTCMEALNLGVPTIIICSEDFFIPDENAVGILEDMRRVKVLFDKPEDAAAVVNQYAHCIKDWWNQKERKTVVNKFREMYASRGRFPMCKWIKELLKESER